LLRPVLFHRHVLNGRAVNVRFLMAKRHNGRLSTPIPIPTPTPTGSFCLVASFSPTPESVKRGCAP
jgi:hypothetical protein